MTRTDEPHALALHRLPARAGLQEVLAWAVAHAALAPSEHNSQPWRFRAVLHDAERATVELLLDGERRVPVVDPEQREAVLACGAALLNLRLALAGAGVGASVLLCPDPAAPEVLARVDVGGPAVAQDDDEALRSAVPLRGTHRGPFERSDVPADVLRALVLEASAEGAPVLAARGGDRTQLLRLTEQAEQQLRADGAYRREVTAWSRNSSSSHHDGVPGYAHGLGAVRSWLRPTLAAATGTTVPALEPSAPQDAPLLLVVGAADDSRRAVLRAGQAMQRLLLRARVERLAASYLNAALHVPELRSRLGLALAVPAPQVVLRLGYGELVRPTPRRGVGELLTVDPDGR